MRTFTRTITLAAIAALALTAPVMMTSRAWADDTPTPIASVAPVDATDGTPPSDAPTPTVSAPEVVPTDTPTDTPIPEPTPTVTAPVVVPTDQPSAPQAPPATASPTQAPASTSDSDTSQTGGDVMTEPTFELTRNFLEAGGLDAVSCAWPAFLAYLYRAAVWRGLSAFRRRRPRS